MVSLTARHPFSLGLGAALLAACGDDGRATAGASATGTASNPTLTAGSLATGDTGTAGPPTTSDSEVGSDSATQAVTSEPGTGPDTLTGTQGDTTSPVTLTDPGTSSTGPGQLCEPGTTQCADETSVETCAPDGQAWQDPTPCGGKLVCSFGACVSKCEQTAKALSSVGCEYYAIDANNDPVENFDAQPYAVAVSNVDPLVEADVQIQIHDGNAWTTIQQKQVAPKQLIQFDLPDRHINYTGFNPRGAYRILSDNPIIAYQFQPINGESSFTSDASLLLPVAALDTFYYVLGWGEDSYGNAQINIVAAVDGTNVTVTPNTATVAGGPIPALVAGQPSPLPPMNAGDVVQIEANALFAGTYITADKPISVFSTHWCANIPSQQHCCCDHLEEQIYGLQKWGTTYVAARWPVRNDNNPEASYWQVIASEDGTTVNLRAHAEVSGIAQPSLMLAKGEVATLTVAGSVANPGDFMIEADKPIFVMQYLSSSAITGAPGEKAGDPAMAQAVPVEQFRSDYVVLVPTAWIYDWFVLTRKVGSQVSIDGVAVPDTSFTRVGPAGMPSEWEVARVAVPDGVHTLDGDQPFGVVVLGYDLYDSYAYPGGLDQKQINPQ